MSMRDWLTYEPSLRCTYAVVSKVWCETCDLCRGNNPQEPTIVWSMGEMLAQALQYRTKTMGIPPTVSGFSEWH
jgi:hypothetical protein